MLLGIICGLCNFSFNDHFLNKAIKMHKVKEMNLKYRWRSKKIKFIDGALKK